MLEYRVMKGLKKIGSFKTWRHVVNFWTVLFFIAIIYDFFNDNVFPE